jgi:hypothetical protein
LITNSVAAGLLKTEKQSLIKCKTSNLAQKRLIQMILFVFSTKSKSSYKFRNFKIGLWSVLKPLSLEQLFWRKQSFY